MIINKLPIFLLNRGQYFGFLSALTEEELRGSPRLASHASGVVLGVSQIINGLENPVGALSYPHLFSNLLYFKLREQ